MEKVLITGGASGLGYELALQYKNKGAQVTILDINKPKIANTVFVKCDLANLGKETLQKCEGPYDVVICNAGISLSGNFLKHTKEQDEHLHKVNVFGHMQLIRKLLVQNKIPQYARIAFVASASVFFPWPVAISYAASKASLDGFAHALSSYLVGKNISVTRVYPGPMTTPHAKYYKGIAEGKGTHPRKIAEKIIKAIRKRKSKVYPDTASKLFRIAACICPRLLDRIVYKKYEKALIS